ncbi:DUF3253 domain-containing protein [Lewinella sp. IMCC34183]|uniref:DUF3253 domain-containing protein n=1 Tax=Lewinella sp. IMCC34183 TaxID=2248762 RepID=UPI000E2524D0|nr:DUF3253 domain-containing protein [Lewinella sp. IMCC34183]
MDGRTIDEAILDLTRRRGPDKTVCPSEVARHLSPDDWRPLMASVRERARTLARARRIEITQRSEAVDPDAQWRGPIRLRWRREDD